jgi:hypothetical protein
VDQRDQDLLHKQMGHIAPPPRADGTLILVATALFLAGMTLGGYLTAYTEEPPTQLASNDVLAPLTQPAHVAPISR